ncbi:hypothetical protein Btru_049708 [Bulinus truncatus]|nr:hypothetical protein Btru_049708 [Bulinus truncatus]
MDVMSSRLSTERDLQMVPKWMLCPVDCPRRETYRWCPSGCLYTVAEYLLSVPSYSGYLLFRRAFMVMKAEVVEEEVSQVGLENSSMSLGGRNSRLKWGKVDIAEPRIR